MSGTWIYKRVAPMAGARLVHHLGDRLVPKNLYKKRKFRINIPGEDVWEAVLHKDLQIYMQRSPKFLRLQVPEVMTPEDYVQWLLADKDERICDIDGPCGAIEVKPNIWCFFGWWRPDQKAREPGERFSISDLVDEEDDAPGTEPEQETEDGTEGTDG